MGNEGLSLSFSAPNPFFLSMCHKTSFLSFRALLKRRNITPLKWRNKKRQWGPSHKHTHLCQSRTIIKTRQQTPTSRKRQGEARQPNAKPLDQRGNRCEHRPRGYIQIPTRQKLARHDVPHRFFLTSDFFHQSSAVPPSETPELFRYKNNLMDETL